jgi:phage tail tape-measure protein
MARKAKGKLTVAEKKKRHEREAEGAAGGAIAGAALGAVAGPPGVAVGAVFGAAAGAMAGAVSADKAASREAEERRLDKEIGVMSGELGAPNLEHPPAKIGAYSGSSVGPGSTNDAAPAEGPMQTPR